MAEDKTKTENNTGSSEILNDADANDKTTHKISDKQTLVKKILIVAIALLTIFLILIIILLSNRTQTDETIPNNDVPVQIEEQNKEIIVEEELDFKFDFKKLDPEKLNEQLELLTNKGLELEAMQENQNIENSDNKRADASGIFLDNDKLNNFEENQENILNDNNLQENQNINLEQNNENENDENNLNLSKNENKVINKENKTPTITVNNGLILILNKNEENINKAPETTDNSEAKEEKVDNIDLLSLINVAKIKGKLQKKYYDKINNIDSSLLLCRDNQDNIEIYFGPFTNNELQKELLSKLLNAGFTESYSLEMSEEEFNKRCKY
ncbi:hypothetical protein AAX29_00133 [Aliarcobacter thereius]|uniref:SPOR domain-containing protein n=1 Tax=Aliarcobacter thereius TaxID=544718 RepID=A0A1C0B966_9BACT|nr:hypothetical protein [Aliarcobacter thereius]OCM00135.1 hypothetical protein AAX29_00133 [Aliarcobacter thereius]